MFSSAPRHEVDRSQAHASLGRLDNHIAWSLLQPLDDEDACIVRRAAGDPVAVAAKRHV